MSNLNTGGNTFGRGGKRDGGLGDLGGGRGLGGVGGSAKDEFEFSSWPTPSSHCSQSMAAAAKEKVTALIFNQKFTLFFAGEILQKATNTWNTSLCACYQVNTFDLN